MKPGTATRFCEPAHERDRDEIHEDVDHGRGGERLEHLNVNSCIERPAAVSSMRPIVSATDVFLIRFIVSL